MTASRAVTDLVALLERLAQEWEVDFAPDRARALLEEAQAELPEDAPPTPALVRVGPALGLGVRVVERTPHEVVRESAALVPLAVHGPQGWAIVLGRRGSRARVLAPLGEQVPKAMSAAALAKLVGVAGENDSASWVVAEPTLPMAPVARPAAGDDGHHGHGGQHASPWQRLRGLARLERTDLWIVLVYAFFVGMMALATPLAVQALVSTVSFGTLLQPLVILSFLVIAALLFAGFLRAMQYYVVEVLQRRVFLRLVSDLAYRLPRVRREAIGTLDGSKLVNRFFDVITIQKAAATLLLDGVVLLLEIPVGLLLIAVYSPLLLVFAVLVLIGIFIVVVPLGRGALESAVSESWAKHHTAEWLEDIARNPSLFANATARDGAQTRADGLAIEYLSARRRHFRVLLRQSIGASSLQAVAAATLLGVGGALVMAGQLSLGQLVAAELIVSAIVASLAKISKQLESAYDLLAALDKVGHLIDLPLERETGADPRRDQSGPMALEVSELAYEAHGHVVLDGARLKLGKGERVAVMAAAGAGKTTLLESIVGVRTPLAGRIEVNGEDLRDLHLSSFREQVVFVPENAEVFEGTIAENLRSLVGAHRAGDVRQVLHDVGLLDEVALLPLGLQTRLLPSGAPLSYTQALRLVLARALLKRPGLFLIDGVLDHLSEQHRDAILGLVIDQDAPWTAVVTTRDPAVARRFPRVVRIEDGKLVEDAPARAKGGDA